MVTQLGTDALDRGIPGLLRGASVVALVPATELRGWAAEMAWAIARAAAASGRRTVLVDCFVNAPTLQGMGGDSNDEGLVDAFEYGASLNRIVQQQPQADLYFIPAGTYSSDAEPLMQHPRWRRLSAGFRHEEALLLLYVAAEHLSGLAAEPDGIVVLAPQGLEVAATDAPALTEAVGRGMPLLAVVAETSGTEKTGTGDRGPGTDTPGTDTPGTDTPGTDTPGTDTPGTDLEAASGPRSSVPGPRLSKPFALRTEEPAGFAWGTWMTIVLLLAAVSGGAWWLIVRRQAAAAIEAQVIADSARVQAARNAEPVAPPRPAAESLPFAVQLAALPRLALAYALSDSLAAHAFPAIVAPVRLRRGTSYRVYAGPYASQARGDSALGALRGAGLLAPGAGSVENVPLSLALSTARSREAAFAERDRLRAAGVPVVILGQADGAFRLYAGAYAAGAQAKLLQDLLTPTGGAGTLSPRAGYVP